MKCSDVKGFNPFSLRPMEPPKVKLPPIPEGNTMTEEKYVTVEGSYLPFGHIDASNLPPGTFHYLIDRDSRAVDAIEYTCPCGCGTVCVLPFIEGATHPSVYTWNGNYSEPTIEPGICDIDDNGGPHWRGRITDGVFVGRAKHDG